MARWRGFVAADEELVAVFPSLGLAWLVVRRADEHRLVLVVEEGRLSPLDRALGWWFRPAMPAPLHLSVRSAAWVPSHSEPMGDAAWIRPHVRAASVGWWLVGAAAAMVIYAVATLGVARSMPAWGGLVIVAFLIRGVVVPALGPWMVE
jgi:hypothetical protein